MKWIQPFIVVFAATLLFMACNLNQFTPNEEEINRFVQVYTDYLKIISSDTAKVKERSQYLLDCLTNHDMTQDQFIKILTAIKQDPDLIFSASDKISIQLFSVKKDQN